VIAVAGSITRNCSAVAVVLVGSSGSGGATTPGGGCRPGRPDHGWSPGCEPSGLVPRGGVHLAGWTDVEDAHRPGVVGLAVGAGRERAPNVVDRHGSPASWRSNEASTALVPGEVRSRVSSRSPLIKPWVGLSAVAEDSITRASTSASGSAMNRATVSARPALIANANGQFLAALAVSRSVRVLIGACAATEQKVRCG
jgi:hypothetical protein